MQLPDIERCIWRVVVGTTGYRRDIQHDYYVFNEERMAFCQQPRLCSYLHPKMSKWCLPAETSG